MTRGLLGMRTILRCCEDNRLDCTHAVSQVTMASGEEGESLLTDLASISCLVVWYPASPTGKIVRLLFPGNASQVKHSCPR